MPLNRSMEGSLVLSAPFKVCGITASTNGSDGDICCLKLGQAEASVTEAIATGRAKLNLEEDTDDYPLARDVEADLEEDEAVIKNNHNSC